MDPATAARLVTERARSLNEDDVNILFSTKQRDDPASAEDWVFADREIPFRPARGGGSSAASVRHGQGDSIVKIAPRLVLPLATHFSPPTSRAESSPLYLGSGTENRPPDV